MSEKDEEKRVIPVADEELKIERQRRETGGVRVHKVVHTEEETIDEPVIETDVDVRRVSIDEFVDEKLGVHQQGDTTIIPIYEEVVVTEKKLRLKEEIRITRSESTTSEPRTVTVRREEAKITSYDESDNNNTQPPEKSP